MKTEPDEEILPGMLVYVRDRSDLGIGKVDRVDDDGILVWLFFYAPKMKFCKKALVLIDVDRVVCWAPQLSEHGYTAEHAIHAIQSLAYLTKHQEERERLGDS